MSSAPEPAVAIDASEAPLRAKQTGYPQPFAARVAGREKRPLGDLFGLTADRDAHSHLRFLSSASHSPCVQAVVGSYFVLFLMQYEPVRPSLPLPIDVTRRSHVNPSGQSQKV